jgi:hypothetical protein
MPEPEKTKVSAEQQRMLDKLEKSYSDPQKSGLTVMVSKNDEVITIELP